MAKNHLTKSFPYLKRYVAKKLRRKWKTKPKLRLTKHDRIGAATPYTVYVSKRLTLKNPVLAKAVLVHELAECLLMQHGISKTRSHLIANRLEREYLKRKGTSYRKEASKYRKAR